MRNGLFIDELFKTKFWFINGKLHRLDGPAVERSDGHKEWWYEDQRIDCSSQEEFEYIIKLKVLW